MPEALVSMPVEREPLEERADVKNPIAPPLEPLDAVVESLNTPARLPPLEVVRALIQPPIDRPQNALELGQPALTHPLAPRPDRALGPRLRVVAFEPFRQVFPQVVGCLDLRRGGEDPLEQLPLRRFEIPRPLAKRPHRPLKPGVLGFGPGAREPLEFLLAPRVGAVAGGPRHGEPIDGDLGPRHLRFERPHEAFIHLRARALDGAPKVLGHRAQAGRYGLLLAVREHRQELDASPLERHRHQDANIAVPARERDLVETDHPPPLPGVPVDCARDPAIEEARDGFLRDPELAGCVRNGRVDQHPPGPLVVRLRVGASRLVPRAPWRRRWAARTGGASIPFGPNLDADGHVEQRQMRRCTTASHPCRSRISRPQRRHWTPSRVLSTRMSQCPCSVLCVERTRTSGTFSGI